MSKTLRALGAACAASLCLIASAKGTIVVSHAPTANMTCGSGSCNETAPDAVMNVDELKQMLQQSNLVLHAAFGTGDIEVTARLGLRHQHKLTLLADRSVLIDAPVTLKGRGKLAIAMGNQGVLAFAKSGSMAFSDERASLTINGLPYKLVASIASLAAAVTQDLRGNYALARSYDAAGDGIYTLTPLPEFSGRFEGLGNRIAHFTLDNAGGQGYVGLFGRLEPTAVVENLAMVDAHVSTSGFETVGVLAGDNLGTVARVYTSGSVDMAPDSLDTGGIVGANIGTLTQSEADVAVTGNRAGGLAGENQGAITNSFAKGAIVATDGPNSAAAGGLIAVDSAGSLSTSYSVGAVSGAADAGLGGAIGVDFGTNAKVYWTKDTSGQSKGCGFGGCSGVTGLSTAKLRSKLPSGFDPAIWGQSADIDGGLPYLLALPKF